MNQEYWELHKNNAKILADELTVKELISQLMNNSVGVPRLNIKDYNWWNECLHGVARAGVATVFPQAIAMAATFSEDLLFDVASVISNEARAKYNYAQSIGDYDIYKGLTMWTPNINIFRDPRWGRGQETYGEDPYLTSILGMAFIKGLQGDDKYIKTAACAKHFAVHSGPEEGRHSFNAKATKKDMVETYLPAFKRAVVDTKVCGVMGAYNRTNDEACCASDTLMNKVLRDAWGFDGYYVSDCGAIDDIYSHHHLTKKPEEASALALNTGCDLECGTLYCMLDKAYENGLVSEETLKKSVTKLLAVRHSLGMFDDECLFNDISINENATEKNEKFAIEVAEKGIVLLKNNGVLPLNEKEQSVAIIGCNADNELAYLGNYAGDPTEFVTVKKAIQNRIDAPYSEGYSFRPVTNKLLNNEAVKISKNADVILLCTGLDPSMEGEESGELLLGGGGMLGKQGDRVSIDLPLVQQKLLDKLIPLGKKIVILNFSGGCMNFGEYTDKVDAILQCWYPGAKGGEAIANLLYGKVSPSAKLPVTFYNNDDDLPPFEEYSMANRTYRYFDGKVLYPFGYGLTYTNFELLNVEMIDNAIKCKIKNTGNFDCDEVLQLYVTQPKAEYTNPIKSLIKVNRFNLKPNEEKEIEFVINDNDLYSVNDNGDIVYLNGEYSLQITDGNYISSSLKYVNSNDTVIIEKSIL